MDGSLFVLVNCEHIILELSGFQLVIHIPTIHYTVF
jgi:hypothetical protein